MHIEVAKTELRWFFNEAEGELGKRGASLEPGLGTPLDPHEQANRRLESASRYADVHSRYRALNRHHQRVLSVAFTPRRWDGLETWYELAGVAAYLLCPRNLVWGGRRALRLKDGEGTALKARATHVLGLALEAFTEAPCAR